MDQIDIEHQVSIIEDNNEILNAGYSSDEADSSPRKDPTELFTSIGMTKIGSENREHHAIKYCFLECLRPYSQYTKIVAVHKNLCSSLTSKARLDTFKTFRQAVARKCGDGRANVTLAWYGGSKEEISEIVSHGFSKFGDGSGYGESYGIGLYLTPIKRLLDSMAASVIDEDGVRHILLCHVILGKMEVVPAGSKQCYPSSMEFDSGVDNPSSPGRYIVWSAFMNSHVFPSYIISFKSPGFNGLTRNQMGDGLRSTTPWLSFPALLSILLKRLHPAKGALIAKRYDDFRKRKINRQQLIQCMRLIIADDQLLIGLIKSNRHKV